jgi:hypothetical protein
LKTDVNVSKAKELRKKLIFVGNLKATEEKKQYPDP